MTDTNETLSRKRKAESTPVKRPKKASNRNSAQVTAPTIPQREVHITPASDKQDTKLVPAVLTFNYDEAKKHLTDVDYRFGDLFRTMKCKPFEHLERIQPFR